MAESGSCPAIHPTSHGCHESCWASFPPAPSSALRSASGSTLCASHRFAARHPKYGKKKRLPKLEGVHLNFPMIGRSGFDQRIDDIEDLFLFRARQFGNIFERLTSTALWSATSFCFSGEIDEYVDRGSECFRKFAQLINADCYIPAFPKSVGGLTCFLWIPLGSERFSSMRGKMCFPQCDGRSSPQSAVKSASVSREIYL